MALSGVHIACGQVGGQFSAKTGEMLLLSSVAWSRTMTLAGVTDLGAPRNGSNAPPFGDPSFEVRASFDIWFAYGQNPDASKATSDSRDSARIFIPANETRNVFAYPGDRAAWMAA